MDIEYNTDCIVVGAGPCGIAAAIEVAKNGKKVVLLERAQYPGSKNMYGGAVYHTALEEIFGDDVKTIPYERVINQHTYSFLAEDSSFDLTYKNTKSKNAYAIKRFNLEKWMIELAKKQGVYFCPSTLVKNLVVADGKVTGVQTEFEKYYAPVTILADGVNSILARQVGLRDDFEPKDMLLSVKETIKLDKSTIEQRFNLKDDLSDGVNKQYFGSDFGTLKGIKNLFMMTYLYTFKDTIMLGVGVDLGDLCNNGLNINDILNEVKLHPHIAPLIKDGEIVEYSAHMIPEYGYNNLPRLSSDGVLVAGDAAGFVNGVHFEGTNFALISGKLAGQAAVNAIQSEDYSASKLSCYQKYLQKSFILKDLRSYRNVISLLHSRSNSLSMYYPEKIKEFFEIVTSANCKPKSGQFRKFIYEFFFKRNITQNIKDINVFLKCAMSVFFGK